MKIKYVPFLKCKQNEIHALAELDVGILDGIAPFFDYPKKQEQDSAKISDVSIYRLVKKFKKHLSGLSEFYFDIYDLDNKAKVNGVQLYTFLLNSFSEFPLIPVVSIDRDDTHQESVIQAKNSNILSSETVAFRITPEDFQNYDVVHSDIIDMLEPVFLLFDSVDIIFDCRVSSGLDAGKTSQEIHNFALRFLKDYPVRRLIISGSSIPASAADILPSNSEAYIERNEIEIYRNTKNLGAANYVFGDYTTVSPDYSDPIPNEQMQGRITAKLIYSYNSYHYFIRGGALKTKGRDQYYDLAASLCSKSFFRSPSYSPGDSYFDEKSRRIGDQCYVNTVIKPAINSHMTYAAQDFLSDNSL